MENSPINAPSSPPHTPSDTGDEEIEVNGILVEEFHVLSHIDPEPTVKLRLRNEAERVTLMSQVGEKRVYANPKGYGILGELAQFRRDLSTLTTTVHEHKEETRKHKEETRKHKEETRKHKEETRKHKEETRKHKEETRKHKEETHKHKEETRILTTKLEKKTDAHKKEIDAYKEKIEMHKEEIETLKEEIETHKEDIRTLKNNDNGHQAKIAALRTEHQNKIERHHNEIISLNQRVKVLTQCSAGFFDIRRRFIAVYIRNVKKVQDPKSYEAIQKGNSVAHNGDIIGDALLFDRDKRSDKVTFQELYGLDHQEVLDFSAANSDDGGLFGVLDAHATVVARGKTVPEEVKVALQKLLDQLRANWLEIPDEDPLSPLGSAYWNFCEVIGRS